MKFKILIFASLALFTATATMAQADFNYSFYPAPTYTKIESFHVRDTITKLISAKTDTISKSANVLIEKNNGRLSVRSLADVSRTLYDMNVQFSGFDNNGNLVYIAQTKDAETVFVNPLKGTIEIVFQTCVDEKVPNQTATTDGAISVKKYCDITRHVFGRLPNPPVPQTQPKK